MCGLGTQPGLKEERHWTWDREEVGDRTLPPIDCEDSDSYPRGRGERGNPSEGVRQRSVVDAG